jgi:prepilin-type N-terminal cleavage/methylation domain-containing protein
MSTIFARKTRTKGFTLIEVLVASSIMVVVSVLSIGIFASTGRLQESQRSGVSLVNEMQQAMDSIRTDIASVERANTEQLTATVQANLNAVNDPLGLYNKSALILVPNKRDETGALTTEKELVVYCVNQVTSSVTSPAHFGTLRRFSMPVASNYQISNSDYTLLTTQLRRLDSCNASLGTGGTIVDMTTQPIDTRGFESGIVGLDNGSGQIKMQGIRVTLSAEYNPQKIDASNDRSGRSQPITLRGFYSNTAL